MGPETTFPFHSILISSQQFHLEKSIQRDMELHVPSGCAYSYIKWVFV